jgi:membrane protease YdiL (CAAX protease family)
MTIQNIMLPETLPQQYPSRLAVLLILFLVAAPLYGLVGFLGNFSGSKWPVLLGELLLPLPAYLFLRFRHHNVRQIFRLHPVSRRLMYLSAVLAVALHLVIYEIDRLFTALWSFAWRLLPPEFSLLSPEVLRAQLEQALIAQSLLDWAIIILATVVVAGVFEEMLFRGFVQTAFERQHKILTAIMITAAVFAANHAVPWWLAQIFLLGLCLGWMAWRSESILPGAIVHGINNFLAVLFINFKTVPAWLHWQSAEPWLGAGHLHPLLLLVAGAGIYFGLQLFQRYCEEETEIPTFFNSPG